MPTVGGFIVLHLALLLLTSAMPSQLLAIEVVHLMLSLIRILHRVGKVLQRIFGRAVMRIARQGLHHAAGSSQFCAGQIGGCKAAVNAMKWIFASTSVDGVLLVDAINVLIH